ncbi:MAG: zinc ribbon domain-containing protein [Deltaproteobacteria bacterium]|nr:zinc ribbon domain-containing protein [Deltaproteobacteria bacterium]MBW2137501.1 zinc ribbon domain-containing protein [Deltaproteobacteria bacterium]
MPSYDFRCEKCRKRFTLTLTISEYERTKVRCPKCKSTRVKQEITPFQVVTSKKS